MAAPALAPFTVGSPRDERAAVHRRTVRALVLAQVAGGAGLAAGITVAALLAVALGGSTAVSGLPEAVAVAGTVSSAAARTAPPRTWEISDFIADILTATG